MQVCIKVIYKLKYLYYVLFDSILKTSTAQRKTNFPINNNTK